MTRPTKEQQEIAAKIGEFYLKKNNGDYSKTTETIAALKITDLEVTSERVVIHTARPGLLIGHKGKNFDDLQGFLGLKIEIFESICWADVITPVDPNQYMKGERDYYLWEDEQFHPDDVRAADYLDLEEDVFEQPCAL